MAAGRGPLNVLVVGWYPGADDPIAGRFIADQVAALTATGRVRPLVASFEPFWLNGDRALRARAAGAWPGVVEAAARACLVPAPAGAFGPTGIPVARLGTPAGTTPQAGRDNEAVHRERTLLAALKGMSRPVELVHGHVGYPEGAAAARVAARLGVPFVLTEHATYLARILADPALRARYREAGLAASRVIAVGKMLADQIRAELPELTDRLVVIPNTVDIASFPVVGPADRDGNELLWVGYRREVKGTGVLLRAFARVREVRPSTTLRLVGRSTSDDEEAGWRTLAAEVGVADAVRFDPPTDRAGVVAAMTRAGVFVHPGTRETFGIVAVEALASGLPVVAADSGGVTEVLGDDPDALGALVPAGDPEALAAAMLRVMDRRTLFDPDRLRAHVEERYGGAVVAGRIADLYDEVLADANATPSGSRRRATGRVTGSLGAIISSAAPAIPDRPVLVAFDRPALDRLLPRCPAWLLDGLVVVTRGGDVPGAGRTVGLAPDIETPLADMLGWRSAGSPFPSPVRWLRRHRDRARLVTLVMPALEAAVGVAIASARETGLAAAQHPDGVARADATPAVDAPPALILCLGGVDVAASLAAVEAGRARLAPGGLRWLGDVRWAGRTADEPNADGPSQVRGAPFSGTPGEAGEPAADQPEASSA